jgi:hypothetical protein
MDVIVRLFALQAEKLWLLSFHLAIDAGKVALRTITL